MSDSQRGCGLPQSPYDSYQYVERAAPPALPLPYQLVVCPADGWLSVESYNELDQLKDRIRELDGEDVSVAVFAGPQLHITGGPNRFLITPLGASPLFAPPAPGDPVPGGWLGGSRDSPTATEAADDYENDDIPARSQLIEGRVVAAAGANASDEESGEDDGEEYDEEDEDEDDETPVV